ncbi:oxidoreductase [Microbacterium terricola]|uniref:Oxidoreductase n=2 Tax=Microbacterium terricola TaxID=344163 RepID=A0ABM8E3S1_9MICO|nr:oxidoreductase [Microbacterium terricola]
MDAGNHAERSPTRKPRRRRAGATAAICLAGLTLAGLTLAACAAAAPGPTATPARSTSTPPSEAASAVPDGPETIAEGLQAPWSLVFTAAGTPLVDERDSGRILELLADGTPREVGRLDDVAHGGEGGLLGLAVRGEQLYVHSTAAGGNRVQRFALEGSPGSYSLGEGTTLLDGLPSAGNHNGGRIAFGPDGMLYVTAGDAAQPPRAQDPDSLGGKILRMTPDGGIPADNPTPGSLVYSSGHRNVQGLAWADDGTMYATEFGQDTWDELNVIVAGGNYGWPTVEGTGGEDLGFVDPIAVWSPDDASPSGMTIAGTTLYLANLRGEVLRSIDTDGFAATELFAGEYGRLRDVALAPDGRLWLLTNNTDGRGDAREGDDRIVAVPVP